MAAWEENGCEEASRPGHTACAASIGLSHVDGEWRLGNPWTSEGGVEPIIAPPPRLSIGLKSHWIKDPFPASIEDPGSEALAKAGGFRL